MSMGTFMRVHLLNCKEATCERTRLDKSHTAFTKLLSIVHSNEGVGAFSNHQRIVQHNDLVLMQNVQVDHCSVICISVLS